MRFAQNRMYIESYNKCPNCGVLLYEKPANATSEADAAAERIVRDGKTYCSAWCVEWEDDRNRRRAGTAAS